MNICKKLILISLTICSTQLFAEQLHHYQQITAAIEEGKSVRIAIDYNRCVSRSKTKNTQGSQGYGAFYTPNEILINHDAHYIAASLMHFTMSDPAYPNQALYNFDRYKISEDGNVSLTTTTLTAADYKQVGEKVTFHCTLDDTARFYA